MRLSAFVTSCLFLLAACEPDGKVTPVTVQWMDWPAEVNAGQPFRTRLVVWGICATNPQFRPGASANQMAVTFAPYFTFEDDHILCAGATGNAFVVTAIALDDQAAAGAAAGLVGGYIYDAATPICGETRVFHRVTPG